MAAAQGWAAHSQSPVPSLKTSAVNEDAATALTKNTITQSNGCHEPKYGRYLVHPVTVGPHQEELSSGRGSRAPLCLYLEMKGGGEGVQEGEEEGLEERRRKRRRKEREVEDKEIEQIMRKGRSRYEEREGRRERLHVEMMNQMNSEKKEIRQEEEKGGGEGERERERERASPVGLGLQREEGRGRHDVESKCLGVSGFTNPAHISTSTPSWELVNPLSMKTAMRGLWSLSTRGDVRRRITP
ncbi:hypothetical protein EYF80_050104 [Liparis tanakae]|uniref:Uncharacterized protein n=1 Tax=Liparis tanakae TaxID=230148 RepID=A0A4Z2FES1_9TELE|nr:hypothetical protein EYF80_050104 [Liparis tanakae]